MPEFGGGYWYPVEIERLVKKAINLAEKLKTEQILEDVDKIIEELAFFNVNKHGEVYKKINVEEFKKKLKKIK